MPPAKRSARAFLGRLLTQTAAAAALGASVGRFGRAIQPAQASVCGGSLRLVAVRALDRPLEDGATRLPPSAKRGCASDDRRPP
jgi:hypothetical protein